MFRITGILGSVIALLAIGCEKKSAYVSRCVDNLRRIETLKRDWALDEVKSSNSVPTWSDLRPFPESWSNSIPVCPANGRYNINRVGTPPTCSIGGDGHSLPPP